MPVQVHPPPVMDARVKPPGRVSVTVTSPLVAMAPARFDTVTVYAAPLCPCVKLPLCAEVTLSREPAGTLQLPSVCHTLLELAPVANIQMPFVPGYAVVNVTGRFKVRFVPDAVKLTAALIEHWLFGQRHCRPSRSHPKRRGR